VIYVSLFLLSASVLALEITWMRLLDFQQWAHVTSTVISLALLGFAASGTWIALLRSRIEGSWQSIYPLAALLYAVSIPWTFILAQWIPLDPFRLLWELRQWAFFLASCLLLFIPFFLGASCIGMLFCAKGLSIPRIYSSNLSGSGVGVLAALGLLSAFSSKGSLCWIAVGGFLSFLLSRDRKRMRPAWPILFAVVLALSLLGLKYTPVRIFPHKPLAKVRLLPGVETVEEQGGPWGEVHLLKGPSLRSLPGLSLRYGQGIPSGEMIFLDADSVGSRLSLETAVEHPLDFLPYTIQALPYAALDRPHVLVLGGGSGMSALLALYHGAARVSVVEPHPVFFRILRAWLQGIARERFPGQALSLHPVEARGFLRSSREHFDLIVIDRLGSPSAAFTGTQAFRGDYLLTREALQDLFGHLREQGGVLAVASWLTMPPRDNLKLFASFVDVLEQKEVLHPSRHLFSARSWSACMTLLSRSSLDPGDVSKLRAFCMERDFDPVTFTGMRQEEANRKNVLEKAFYHESMTNLLQDEGHAYRKGYLFNIEPCTDDRPYFQHFLKWRNLFRLWREMGRDWVFLREWGTLALWITLVSSVVLGGLILLLPAVLIKAVPSRRQEQRDTSGRVSRLLLFACLGSGFMLYEIIFLETFTLFLSYPMLSVALVLSAILLYSSLGGLATERWFANVSIRRLFVTGCLLTALAGGIYALGLSGVFAPLLRKGLAVRVFFAFVALAPPCILMGIPFPTGLRAVRMRCPEDIPFCWGINGWAAVVSTTLAPLLSISFGLKGTLAMGSAVYLLAGILAFRALREPPGRVL